MKKIFPTIEQFRKDITEIFIDEDLDYFYALELLVYHLNDKIPENDPKLTYETILKKYRLHIDLWNLRNGEKERRGFVNKDQLKKRKNIVEFLESRMYSIDWTKTSTTPQRDNYLLGTLVPQTEVLIQLNKFKKSCQKNQ